MEEILHLSVTLGNYETVNNGAKTGLYQLVQDFCHQYVPYYITYASHMLPLSLRAIHTYSHTHSNIFPHIFPHIFPPGWWFQHFLFSIKIIWDNPFPIVFHIFQDGVFAPPTSSQIFP